MSKERPIVPDGSPKPGTEEYRKAKEKINQEGWEDNAAVIIGTKEELAQKREQLEEGRETVDLRTYIHRNAVTEVTSADIMNDKIIDEATRRELEEIPIGGYCSWYNHFHNEVSLLFKSKNGDIRSLSISLYEITDTKEFARSFDFRPQERGGGELGEIDSRLSDLGFTKLDKKIVPLFHEVIRRVKSYHEDERVKENKQGFEF